MLIKRFLSANLITILLLTLSTQGLGYAGEEEDDCENDEEKTISIDTQQGDLILNIDDIIITRGPHKINLETGRNIDLKISNSKNKLLFMNELNKDDIPDNIILIPPEKDLVVDKSTWFILFGIGAGAYWGIFFLVLANTFGGN
jgi:hypothetical protein